MVEQVQSQVARHSQRFEVGSEQAFKPVGGNLHQENIFLACPGIAAQQAGVAAITFSAAFRQYLQQRIHVGEAQVHAVARERMDHVRGVAHQGHALRDD